MNFDEYVESLSTRPESVSHIMLSAKEEYRYLREAAYRFNPTFAAIPRDSKPLRVLDIGTTPFTFFVKRGYPQYEVWSLDLTTHMRDECAAQGVRFATCNLDDDPMPFEGEFFDVVIFTEVLEHIFRPPSEVLRETARILREGGKLILSVPNIADLKNRLKLLLGVSPLPNPDRQMRKDWMHGHGHLHEYTMKELSGLVRSSGFEIIRRRWLRCGFGHAFRTNWGTMRKLVRTVYYAAAHCAPSLGAVVYLECRRSGPLPEISHDGAGADG